jgi:hypothetical protein
VAVQPDDVDRRAVLDLLERLHRHKDAAYGDAWRKRGEVIAIFANMARKYDRLLIAFDEEHPAVTEPLGDTVADLCVYAAKYLTWIADEHPAALDRAGLSLPAASTISAAVGPDAVRSVFAAMLAEPGDPPAESSAAWPEVQACFDALERALMAQATPDTSPNLLLDFHDKARLAWDLAQNTSWLLVCLEREDPTTLDKVRAEVESMDRTAANR